MRAVLAAVCLLVLAAVLYGDSFQKLFTPAIKTQPMSYSRVPAAVMYDGSIIPYFRTLDTEQHFQQVAYAKPAPIYASPQSVAALAGVVPM